MLELIRQELEKESISYYLLTGSVQKEKRQEYVDRFQQDDTPVFMFCLKQAGTGPESDSGGSSDSLRSLVEHFSTESGNRQSIPYRSAQQCAGV